MDKYKEFYFDFKKEDEDYYYIFSSHEDLTVGKVWKINAKHRSMTEALNVVYDYIKDDIEKWYDRLHPIEKEFYKTINFDAE